MVGRGWPCSCSVWSHLDRQAHRVHSFSGRHNCLPSAQCCFLGRVSFHFRRKIYFPFMEFPSLSFSSPSQPSSAPLTKKEVQDLKPRVHTWPQSPDFLASAAQEPRPRLGAARVQAHDVPASPVPAGFTQGRSQRRPGQAAIFCPKFSHFHFFHRCSRYVPFFFLRTLQLDND